MTLADTEGQGGSYLGQGIRAGNAKWTFEGVAGSFEDHIERSVPGYRDGHDLIARLSD